MRRTGRMILPLALLGLLMLRSDAAARAAAQAVRQSAEVVFPSLFPFFVVSRRLTGELRLRRPTRMPMLMGLCGGYPLGVYSACELYGEGILSETAARSILRCCNNTGPAIFFGMIGATLFPDPVVCAGLFVIHVLSAALTAAVGCDAGKEEGPARIPDRPAEGLMDSVARAGLACARLCAGVVFFSVLLRLVLESAPVQWLLGRLPLDRRFSEAILCAAADLPNGLQAMARVPDPAARLILCAGAVGWGGACVHMQAAGIWRGAGLRPEGYYPAKAFQCAASCAMAFVPARLQLGAELPMWPAALPIAAVCGKKAMDFLERMRYNGKAPGKRRRRYAVSQKDRTSLRLLRQGGEN